MLSNQKPPLYFYLLITGRKEIVLIKSQNGWTLPGRTGYQFHTDDVFIGETLMPFTTRMSLLRKQHAWTEDGFSAMGNVYECHVYMFDVVIEVKPEHIDRDVWLPRPDILVTHALHEHARWVIELPSIKNRLS